MRITYGDLCITLGVLKTLYDRIRKYRPSSKNVLTNKYPYRNNLMGKLGDIINLVDALKQTKLERSGR